MKGTKRLAVLAMFTAIALTIFVAEAQIPPVVPIPGVKLGLANIVTLIAMALIGRRPVHGLCGHAVLRAQFPRVRAELCHALF